MNKKVVLAFSGGLDTTYCAIYLKKELNLEVHAVTINTGGFSEGEVNNLAIKAKELGVASFQCINVLDDYYQKCIKYLVFGNVLKNNTYPLSVSAERIFQAIALANAAKSIEADYIAHGSTGAGNDQVRFDMIFTILIPGVQILTPIRDLKLKREQEITYLKDNGLNYNFEKAKYSINKGIWGTSIGGVETLKSRDFLPDDAFLNKVTATTPCEVTLQFTKGELTGIDNKTFEKPADAILKLNEIGAAYGIGREIHVGDTIIGIKGRVGFEAPAPLLIIKAHHALEKHTLTKFQLYWKDQLSLWYGNWLHEGQFLDPVMRNIEQFFSGTQEQVTGKVFIQLFPYYFRINGIESEHDLMSDKFGSYGEMNKGWSGADAKGFAKILANNLSIYNAVNGLQL